MRAAITLALFLVLAVPVPCLGQDRDDGRSQETEEVPAPKQDSSAFVGDPSNREDRLQTQPRDIDFGRRSSQLDERFLEGSASSAAVDRRREITAMADRNILAPMAQTLERGTLSYSNYNIFGNYLTYAPTDKLSVTGGMVFPVDDGDFVSTVSGKYKFFESHNWLVSLMPFGAYSEGTMDVDTYQLGLGAGLLVDFYAGDSLVLTGGALGFATLAAGYERYSDNCTRSEFSSQNCGVETTDLGAPSGGHWIAGVLGLNWFLSDSFALNFKYIFGGSWGTFLGIEDSADGNDLAARRDRFESPDFASGFPYGRGPVTSLGVTWSSGSVGLQLAVVSMGVADDPSTLETDESQESTSMPLLSGVFHF